MGSPPHLYKGNNMTVNLKDVGSGFKRTAINENFETIETSLNTDFLRKDGAQQMEGDLDANSKRIINLPDALDLQEPATLSQLVAASDVTTSSTDLITHDDGGTDVTLAAYLDGVAREAETVADMKAFLTYSIGDSVRTKGYYAAGDGGGATYMITAPATTDGYGDHTLDDGNAAILQMNATAKVVQFGAKGDDSSNDQPSIQAATNKILSLGGGTVLFDGRIFRVNGAASVDSFLNVILVPFQGVFGSAVPKIRFVGVGGATLQCMTDNTIILRASTPGLEVEGLNFKGLTASTFVVGIGAIPEDYPQTTTQVSQSYQKITGCTFRSLTEGYWLEAGPTILGSQSGSFYPNITNCDFNLVKRGIHFNHPASDTTNRVTRANIAFCRFERGNVGIHLAHASETMITGCYAQFFTREGPLPTAEASFLRIEDPSRYTWLYGGTGEANNYDIYNLGGQDNSLMVHGFPLTSINFGIGQIPVLHPTLLRLTDRTGATEKLSVTARDSNFAQLSFDWDANGTRDVNIESNMVRRMSWFNGVTTHYGSVGNIVLNSGGNRISGTGTSMTLACDNGPARLTGQGVVYLNNATGDVVQASGTQLSPFVDNALSLGSGALRWTQLFAQTGAINTSDERSKTALVDIEATEKLVALEIKAGIRKFKFKDAVALKGEPEARIHFGVGAQSVKAAFEGHGLNPYDYSLFCYDEWEREVDAEGVVLREAGNAFGIRYEELLCFIISAI